MSSILENLLPGIPDDVTLNHIVTKLTWPACYSLSAVSLGWEKAIASRLVHDARVYHQSTETLVVVKHQDSQRRFAVSVYSMKDKAVYQLPPIPNLGRGIPWWSQLISLDNKVYLLGDVKNGDWPREWTTDKQIVYALDLVGKRQWEVSDIPDPISFRFAKCGGVLRRGASYARGGNQDYFISAWHTYDRDMYGWRMASPFHSLALDRSPSKYFIAHGKIYWIRSDGIFVAGVPNTRQTEAIRQWTFQHSKISCDEICPKGSVTIVPLFILPVNGEVLTIVRWKQSESHEESYRPFRYCLLQSKGFGTARTHIVWEKGPDSFHFDEYTPLAVCPVQL